MNGFAVGREPVRETGENARPFGAAVFEHLVIGTVIATDAENLFRCRDREHVLDVVEQHVGICGSREFFHLADGQAGNGLLQAGMVHPFAHIHDSAVLDDAVGFPPGVAIADQFHDVVLPDVPSLMRRVFLALS